jgi:hypothetical protein
MAFGVYAEVSADRAQKFSFIMLALAIGVTLAVWRYDNRVPLAERAKAQAKTAELKRIRETPARTTQPSADETKMAQSQLFVAWNIILKSQGEKHPEHALYTLEAASKALAKVRELDPGVSVPIVIGKDKEPTPFTHDSMTAAALFLESKYLWRVGSGVIDRIDPSDISKRGLKQGLAEAETYFDRSREAARKAVVFEPEHVPYLLQLAAVTKGTEHRDAVERALKVEPYNVKALELANGF